MLGAGGCTATEAPPATDVYLLPLETSADGMTIGPPQNVTSRAGYDNQPTFLADSNAFFYTSIGEDGQADIHRYDLGTRRSERQTRTPEHEYSPSAMPTGGGFSVVRVEADGRQRLWRFDADWNDPRLVAEDVEPVGYHAWIDGKTLGLYILAPAEDQPATLEILDLERGQRRTVASRIGRSIAMVPGRRALSYVDMSQDQVWWIRVLDVDSGENRNVVATLAGCEDYAWTPDGTLLMPCGSSLYQWSPGSADWRRLVDLAPHGLSELSRVALSPDGRWLALVGLDS